MRTRYVQPIGVEPALCKFALSRVTNAVGRDRSGQQDNLFPLPSLAGRAGFVAGAFEIVFVDDGSIDGSYARMSELAARDERQGGGLQAFRPDSGLARRHRPCFRRRLVTMDGDLQNKPRTFPLLKKRIGLRCRAGPARQSPGFVFIRTFPSRIANWLIRKVTGVPFRDFGCTGRCAGRRGITALR